MRHQHLGITHSCVARLTCSGDLILVKFTQTNSRQLHTNTWRNLVYDNVVTQSNLMKEGRSKKTDQGRNLLTQIDDCKLWIPTSVKLLEMVNYVEV